MQVEMILRDGVPDGVRIGGVATRYTPCSAAYCHAMDPLNADWVLHNSTSHPAHPGFAAPTQATLDMLRDGVMFGRDGLLVHRPGGVTFVKAGDDGYHCCYEGAWFPLTGSEFGALAAQARRQLAQVSDALAAFAPALTV